MSKLNNSLDHQLSLLDLIDHVQRHPQTPSEGSLDVKNTFQALIIDTIKKSDLSRWEIAGKMSALIGVEITKYMLDAWTSESKDGHRFPAIYLPAFCQAVGDYRPIKILAEKAGVFVLPGVEVLHAEMAKRIKRRDKENREIKRIKMFLRELEGKD